jgi:23S rRNA (adenine2503-C2)-methyltransferase
MQCAFCATGRLGLRRNLAPHEIVGSFLAVRDDLPDGRVTGAVFMGQGEPFHNYDAVIQAARVLCDPCGARIDAKNITISTVGLVPQIRRYTREGHKFRLFVSLTSAVQERRVELLPVAGRMPLTDLADALRERYAATGRRQTLAWVLLAGVNTGQDEVDGLLRVFEGIPLRIDLIDVNDHREGGFCRADDAERTAFFDRLQVLNAPIVRRYSVGQSENSACGMLASLEPSA